MTLTNTTGIERPMIEIRGPSLWRTEWNTAPRAAGPVRHRAQCLCPICQDKHAAILASRKTSRRNDP